MKKLIALTLALCMVLCLLSGCGTKAEETPEEAPTAEIVDTLPETPEAAPEVTPEATPEPAGIGLGGTGYETFPADMVVATVNGTEVTWMEYFYWLRYYTMYIQQLAGQYGMILDGWDAHDLSGENTNAQVVLMNAQANIIRDHAIRTETAKLGVELTEEDLAELASLYNTNADQVVGNGDGEATEEELISFEGYLASEMFVDKDFFNSFNSVTMLNQRGFEAEFGEHGEKLSDEETLAFAEDNGLLAAKHILFLTVDSNTHEPLSDEEIAAKRQQAEDLYAQLSAVRDDPEALAALFDELTAEYTEDTGYAHYPDGYVFGEGEMVSAFEDTVKLLEIGGLSEVVESEYGFHIILRIPVDPNAVIGTDANGNDVTLRYAAATRQYDAELTAWTDAAEVVWSEGFETPDLAAIFG